MTPAVEIEGVDFGYPGQPLLFSGLSLSLPAGSALAVLGPNGRGKSSLLRLLSGLERPLRGRIRVAGLDLCGAGPPEVARLVGMVAQSSDRHFLRARVSEEVALGARTLGLRHPEALARDALDRLGIADLAGSHPLDLDAGQRRLVALAAAVAHDPRLLLLDEAQRGLDRLNRARLEALIGAEVARGATVLAVTHDMDFARRIPGRPLLVSDAGVALGEDRAAAHALAPGPPPRTGGA